NNSFNENTIDLNGRSSTGIELDGEDFGTRITGNHFTGGTTYDNGYSGTAIRLGSAIGSAPSGRGAFPLPEGWTGLASLGAGIARGDPVGGFMVGVEHSVK